MTAAGDEDTRYSDRELAFAVPVLWWEKRNPRIRRPALIPLYIFAGTDWNAVTSYEVYGQLSLKSKLVNPDTSWLVALTGLPEPEPLVTVETELFPELGKSQEAQDMSVLEIFSAPGTRSARFNRNLLEAAGAESLPDRKRVSQHITKTGHGREGLRAGELPIAGSTASPIHGKQRFCWKPGYRSARTAVDQSLRVSNFSNRWNPWTCTGTMR